MKDRGGNLRIIIEFLTACPSGTSGRASNVIGWKGGGGEGEEEVEGVKGRWRWRGEGEEEVKGRAG